MTNNRTLFSVCLLAGCLAAPTTAQPGLLGGAGTYSRDGWKFSCSYVLKPPLLPGQHSSIQGQTDVMHTDAKAGSPVIFHRFLTDPASKTYLGYDVLVEPVDGTNSATLRFRPFSLTADRLPKEYHAAEFLPMALPKFPVETFQSGQTIAIDLLTNPATGQKLVDYIQVSFEPDGSVLSHAAPRDFQVSDVLLHVVAPSLRVNDVAVTPAVVADSMIRHRLVWLSVPGHGRFLLSLAPYAGFPFQKSGVVSGYTLAFAWNGERYEWRSRQPVTESSGAWNLYVLAAAPAQATATEFSFGAVDTVDQFLSKVQ
jgi:hypothetical protein